MPISPTDRDLMIRTVIGEADDQPPIGQAAVAHVVLNRMADGRWGDTPSQVVLSRGQFEPWQTRSRELSRIDPTSPRYQKVAGVVDAVLRGDVPDPTGGATHFLQPDLVKRRRGGSLPDWASGEGLKIGDHAFYRPAEMGAPPASDDLISEWLTGAPKAGAAKPSAAPAPDEDLISDWLPKGDATPPAPAAPVAAKPAPTEPALPPAPPISGDMPLPGAMPGRDEKGNPGWFISDPNRPGKYVQVTPRSAKDAKGGRDAQGRPGLFTPDPDRPGKYLQVKALDLTQPREVPRPDWSQQSIPEMMRNVSQRARNTALGTGPGSVSGIPGAALPFALEGAGVVGGPLARLITRGVSSVAKPAWTLGKLWAAEKALETLVPEQWQPDVIKALHIFREAH